MTIILRDYQINIYKSLGKAIDQNKHKVLMSAPN